MASYKNFENRLINKILFENVFLYDISYKQLKEEVKKSLHKQCCITILKHCSKKELDRIYKQSIENIVNKVFEHLLEEGIFYERRRRLFNYEKYDEDDEYDEYDEDYEEYDEYDEDYEEYDEDDEYDEDYEEYDEDDEYEEEIMIRKLINSEYSKPQAALKLHARKGVNGKVLENEINKNKLIDCIKKYNLQTPKTTNNKQLEKIENELNEMKERLRRLEEK